MGKSIGIDKAFKLGADGVGADYLKDLIKFLIVGKKAGLRTYQELFCGGEMLGCEAKEHYPGKDSTTIMGWENVNEMMRQTVEKTWSGEWWREPVFGETAKQHAVLRRVKEEAFSPGPKGSQKYKKSESTIKSMVEEFLASRTTMQVSEELTTFVFQVNNKITLDWDLSWEEAKDLMDLSERMTILSIVIYLLPPPLTHLLDQYLDNRYSELVQQYLPFVKARWGSLDDEDCSPGPACSMKMAQSFVDALVFAGGLSVSTGLAIGVATLFSEHETNPFPARAIPQGKELNFWWEVIRYFPTVVGFDLWETRPTCPGLSAEETAELNMPGGGTLPCPAGKDEKLTGFQEVNLFEGLVDLPTNDEGAVRLIPNVALTGFDPAKWGPDAGDFVVRSLTDYIKNSLSFAEAAVDDDVAEGRNNVACPGKSLSLMIGEQFFKTFNKEDWVAASAGDIKFKSGPTWVSEFEIRKE